MCIPPRASLTHSTMSFNVVLVRDRADELEKLSTLGVFGVDGGKESSAVRELHNSLKAIRDGLSDAQKLWKSAEEAADKCQV